MKVHYTRRYQRSIREAQGINSDVRAKGSCGCTHFRFDESLDLKLDKKLKDSITINNYRV